MIKELNNIAPRLSDPTPSSNSYIDSQQVRTISSTIIR